MNYIYDMYSKEYSVDSVNCCTEYKIDCVQMQCHPSYQGEGAWFDWVNVYFASSKCDGIKYQSGLYPCKVLAIVPKELNDFLEETEIVVQCALQ
jgi:hypothetical protein